MVRRGLTMAGAMILVGAALATGADACGPRGRQHHGMTQSAMPRGGAAAMLPAPQSHGAQLVGAYCTQCHGAPSPALHSAQDWRWVAERMYRRMQQFPNRVYAPSPRELATIVAYLEAHAPDGSGVP